MGVDGVSRSGAAILMLCPSCNRDVPDDGAFCMFCGKRFAPVKEKKSRRRKGERKDGLIPVTLELPRNPDGTRNRKWFYGKTRADALRQKQEYLDANKPGASFDPNITVAQWADVYKATYRTKINKAYIVNDDSQYNRLVDRLGKKRIVDIRESDLQNAFNEVADMSFSTVTKYESTLKKVFKKARKNKIIPDDPSEDLIRPPYTKGTHRALEGWEIDMILANWNNPFARTGIWFMLMLLCGLRRGEMMALRWENVDLEKRILTVCEVAVVEKNQSEIEDRTKSAAGERILPIPKALHEALSTIPYDSRNGLICRSAKGRQLSQSAVDAGVDHFCNVMTRILNNEPVDQRGRRKDIEKRKEATIADDDSDRLVFAVLPHDLRHSFATALYDASVPIKAAQYFLGHADIKMTLNLYTHLSREREKESRIKLVDYFDNWVENRLLGTGVDGLNDRETDLNFTEGW